jgi:hypothetical protein
MKARCLARKHVSVTELKKEVLKITLVYRLWHRGVQEIVIDVSEKQVASV